LRGSDRRMARRIGAVEFGGFPAPLEGIKCGAYLVDWAEL